MLHGLDHELGDPFASCDLEVRRRIMVDEADLQLTSIARVDEPRRIEAGDAVLERKPTAGLHEPRVALGKGDGDARGNERAAPGSGQRDVLPGQEVDAGIAGTGVGREREIRVKTENRQIEHVANVVDRDVYPETMLAWMDLEMTGLEPGRHVIVEIATLLTDDNLELIAEGPDLIVHATAEQLGEMDDFVTNMHTRSGLLEAIQTSTVSLEEAGDATLAFLKEHIGEERTVPLCGNSIGTDRRFLAEYLPEIEDFLHYRSIDVSTLKELARRWKPEAFSAAPKKAGGHRALDDIRESLDELRHYRAALFTDQTPTP